MASSDVTLLPDGTTRYRVYVDGGISPSGVGWQRVVEGKRRRDHDEASQEMQRQLERFAAMEAGTPVDQTVETQWLP